MLQSKMLYARLFLICCLLQLTLTEIICPDSCECSGGSHHKTMECTNLTRIPKLTPDSFEQIIKVVFNHNPLKLAGTGSNKDVKTDRLQDIGYKDIHVLEMKNCKLEDIPGFMLKDLRSLRTLDLSENLLTSVDQHMFRNLPQLSKLDLSKNKITMITSDAFITLPNLYDLDLSANKLTSLQIQDLASTDRSRQTLIKLSKLNLKDNKWKCDCEFGKFAASLRLRKISPEGAKCFENNQEAGLISEKTEFTCSPNLLTVTPYQAVHQGDDVTLECKYEANPSPSVFWSLGGDILDGEDFNLTTIIKKDELTDITVVRSKLKLGEVDYDKVGDYVCNANNRVGIKRQVIKVSLIDVITDPNHTIIIVSVVSVVFVIAVVAAIAAYCCVRKRRKESVNKSFALLNCSNSLPPMRKDELGFTPEFLNKNLNPVPKPPRTGMYTNNNIMNSVDCSTLGRRASINIPGIRATDHNMLVSHYVSNQHLAAGYGNNYPVSDMYGGGRRTPDFLQSPELLHVINNRPGSRSSIGTSSTFVSSSSYMPDRQSNSYSTLIPLNRTQTHPPQLPVSRPGYVTLPRKPRSRPVTPSFGMDDLGPRTRGDGSSLNNIADSRVTSPTLLLTSFTGSDKHDSSNSDMDVSKAETEDSPPSKPVLDTIIEQEDST